MEKIKLPAKLTKIEPNQQLLAQAVKVYLSNQRTAHAKTKTRGEVNKTTAKMYKQKGTGRARHGSSAAPLFVGGGRAFGPTGEQNYDRKLSKSQIGLAFVSALVSKSKDLYTLVVDKIKSTKQAHKLLIDLRGSILIVLGAKELSVAKYFRNLPKVTVTNSGSINTYEVIKHQQILFTDSSLEEVTKKYVA